MPNVAVWRSADKTLTASRLHDCRQSLGALHAWLQLSELVHDIGSCPIDVNVMPVKRHMFEGHGAAA